MIAYNTLWLSNLFIRQQAAEAFQQNCLDKEEWVNINNHYPSSFYSPNFFIRIGLFILTTVIVLFSFGLFSLLFLNSIEHAVGGFAVFFALVAYVALEYLVRTKKHLQSGADDALLWISACCLFGGLSYISNAGDIANCIIIFIISLFCALRFADRVMSVVSFIAFLGFFFFMGVKMGEVAKAFVPFIISAISVFTWFLTKRKMRLPTNLLYTNCLQVILIAALLFIYFPMNYFVVREFSNAMFNLNLAANDSIPFGWFFWLFTLVMPFVYIIRGIHQKDIILIRVSLLLLAAIVFTIRYYYFLGSIEMMMAAGGIILILISYVVTRYLKTPKYSFTNLEINTAEAEGNLQLEGLLQVQTLGGHAQGTEGTQFGGGSFGGGGTSGDF